MAKEGKKISTWFEDLKTEFKRIIWLDRSTVVKQTTATVIASVIVGLLIAVLDMIFKNGIDILVNL
ncbi:MAG: preprotein translocase subunit SecE [Lachnospiraceae bacterium]|jgi:preprotein translocase subunit SecE|nr:preprotein translocase subunit SecE [Lachnospiraceae bacterium]